MLNALYDSMHSLFGRMEGWKDGRMEGWKDGRMDGWMDGWMDGPMYHSITLK